MENNDKVETFLYSMMAACIIYTVIILAGKISSNRQDETNSLKIANKIAYNIENKKRSEHAIHLIANGFNIVVMKSSDSKTTSIISKEKSEKNQKYICSYLLKNIVNNDIKSLKVYGLNVNPRHDLDFNRVCYNNSVGAQTNEIIRYSVY